VHSRKNLHAPHASALAERHRDIDRIDAADFLHMEARFDVIHLRQREKVPNLAWRNLVHINSAVAIENRDAPVLLEPVLVATTTRGMQLRDRRIGRQPFVHN
jgi:hypothetical protein